MKLFKLNNQDLNILIKFFFLANFLVSSFFFVNSQFFKDNESYRNNVHIKKKIIQSADLDKLSKNHKIIGELNFARSFIQERRFFNKSEVEVLIDTLAPYSIHSLSLKKASTVKTLLLDGKKIDFDQDGNKINFKKKIQLRNIEYNQRFLSPLVFLLVGEGIEVKEFGIFNDFNGQKIEPKRFYSTLRNDNKVTVWKKKIFSSGEYVFKDNIRIPKEAKIKIIGNVTFLMGSNSNIESQSLFDIDKGNLTIKPIKHKWGTLSFRNVSGSLNNMTIISSHRSLTGDGYYDCALCFYNSEVSLNKIIIKKSEVEDSLYGIKSVIELSNSKIMNGQSDGFDCDFCEVSIKESEFSSNNGDGLDISGSKFQITTSVFESNKDKGISVGEESQGKISHSSLKENLVGIAVKDGSFARLISNHFFRNQINIKEYIKKSIYSSPKVVYE